MSWWRRLTPAPPVETRQEQIAAARSDRELDEAHAEADRALNTVRDQIEEKCTIRQVLRDTLHEDLLLELWRRARA